MVRALTIQKDIRFKTVETPTAWIVLAVLIERIGGQTVVSEPRIVRVIAKKLKALPGKIKVLCLSAFCPATTKKHVNKIVSPYVSFLTSTESGILAWCGARPPTF